LGPPITGHSFDHYANDVPDERGHLFRAGLCFYPKQGGWKGLGATTAKLVVEIADTSLAYDLGRKAGLYASFGITDLWVIHAVTLQTRIIASPRRLAIARLSISLRRRHSSHHFYLL
jgi:hypothetical protein